MRTVQIAALAAGLSLAYKDFLVIWVPLRP